MNVLLFLALFVFAGSAIADSVVLPGNAAATGARTHLEFTIVIPALIYRDRVTGDWRTNARKSGPLTVARSAGRPDNSMTALHQAGGQLEDNAAARALGDRENRVAYMVVLP